MPAAQDPQQIHSNKRKLTDNGDLHNSAYFKIRALARQLRPQFIQILQTPDFRNCKAAQEVKLRVMQFLLEHPPARYKALEMKLMINLYKEMIAETHQEGKQSDRLKSKQSMDESTEKKPQTHPFSSDKKLDYIGQPRESYIVGGSAFGWNFITFSCSKPVYYGASKESFWNSQKRKVQ